MADFAIYPSLRERCVLVTGGASGIGASIVEHFVAQGARVGFIDLDAEGAERIAASLGDRRGNAAFARADLRDIGALRQAIDALREKLGGSFSVLVNNAARDDRHSIDEVTPEYWDDRMNTNLRHQFFAAQALKDEMIQAGGGSIINFTSISFRMATRGMPLYLTAKAAVIGLTRALARDLGRHHIRVNSVMPGWIMTQRQIDLWLTPEDEANLMKSQCIPEKLYPPDISRMVLWLAAEDSRLVTAQTFVVDGGRT
jgi:D-xylose 1-dehydrogenase